MARGIGVIMDLVDGVEYVFLDKKTNNLGTIKKKRSWCFVAYEAPRGYDYCFMDMKHYKNSPSTLEIVTENCECLGEL